jgi:predicted PurR-regulated permease PerM
VVATLYLARAVLIPMALAVVLCFLLSPLVHRLQRWGLGRVPAVIVVTVLSFAAIGTLGYVVTVEAISLAETLPQYKGNIREKVRVMAAPRLFGRATERIREATEEAISATTQAASEAATQAAATAPDDASQARPAHAAPTTQPDEPLTVRLAEPAVNPLESLAATIFPLLGPLGTAGIVILFVIFMLIERESLRDRIIGLIGPSQVNITTQAIDDAARRVSRYFLMQFAVNGTYGVVAGVGLWLMGVESAVLWGVLCFVLRYIPYIGPWLGAAMPILLSLAASDGWTQPLMVIVFFVVLELVSNNVMEPLFYGKGTGVSPMAVIVSAVFWTWLWGAPGLVLAMPLTVCVVVMGRYVPQMEWLSRLLSDEPGLPLPSRVYQRLLAMDQDEALTLAKEFLKDNSLLDWYQHVMVPALMQAEHDRHNGALDDDRAKAVYTAARSMVEEVGEWADENADERKAGDKRTDKPGDDAEPSKRQPRQDRATPAANSQPLILIVPARDEADEVAGMMLCQLLTRQGQRCQTAAAESLSAETSQRAVELKPAAICVSAMPPMAVSHARYMCKRLSAAVPGVRLVVGVWHASDLAHATTRVRATGGETVVATFSQAIEALRM